IFSCSPPPSSLSPFSLHDALPILPQLIATLRALGCELRDDVLDVAQRGDFGARLNGIRIDIFLPVIPLSDSALSRRVRMPFRERSEEHTSELQSRENLVCRLLLEK